MARLVRDLSHKSGKPAEFRGEGEDTEMDRRYVDLVHDPLVHLIRNAVDHGIEPEAERLRLGKPAQGSVVLRAYHEGGQIRIELEDDGRGLQRQAILEKALRMGLIDSAEGLTDQEAFALIFQPGFSTAKQVTEISGRGVGMDVVRRNIQSIRGDIALESEPGQGTRIRLSLPLTLALIDGLVVKVGEERFIFPVHAVLESIRPAPGDVSTVAGQGELLALRDGQVPLFRLGTLFHVREAASDPTRGMVIVAECGGRRYGLLVDHVLGLQQTVIKALGQGLRPVEGISGGTILGDGGVGLIVDVHALVQGARRPPAQVHSA
jgi:two-component system chemotaxis sensor kinase CheA